MIILLNIAGLAFLGLLVGIFSTGLGLGGGVLMVPAFITFLPEMDMHTAKGTSLFIILLVALTGFPRVRRMQKERPRLSTSLFIAIGALAGGYVGAAATAYMPEKALLAIFMLFVFFLMLRLVSGEPVPSVKPTLRHRNSMLFLIGTAAGAAGSATGTGGGSLLAPMILLTGLLPHTQLVYTANQVMIATSLAAAPAHFLAQQSYHNYFTIGQICLEVVPIIVLFAQIGIFIGARINKTIKENNRRRLLAVVLAMVALRMLVRVIGG